jgi:CubicO group peptidase (beta-lactamase class C family)
MVRLLPPWVILCAFILQSFSSFIVGDPFDDAVVSRMRDLNIRGASVVYFDGARMTNPIVRGYGKVATSSSSLDVTPDTTFLLASVSKVFTGSAIAILLKQGRIRLDDDICNVIPSTWQRSACRNPRYPNTAVTWRMIASHRSSLREDIPDVQNRAGEWVEPSYGPTGGYVDGVAAGNPTCPLTDYRGFYRDFLTNKATETRVGTVGLTVQGGGTLNWYRLGQSNGGAWQNFAPGTRESYSNFAMGYIAALVELATNQTWANFTKQHLFAPLGMNRTAWHSRDLPAGTRQAVPVEFFDNQYADIGPYCFIDAASGSLLTTANDMAKWLQSMLRFGAPRLWNETIGRQVFACQQRTAQGVNFNPCEVGLGWIRLDEAFKRNAEDWLTSFQTFNWTQGVMHDGSEAGAQTQILVLPSSRVYLAVLTNTDYNDEYAAQKLARTVATAS